MQKSYYAVIPANVRYCKNISANAKLLYGEITALCHQEGYCWSSNEYFAELYGSSTRTVSRWISELKDNGFIQIIEIKKGKLVTERQISIAVDKNVQTTRQKCHEGHDKNVQDNNTSINITDNKKILKKKEREEKALELLDYACKEMLITGKRAKWKYKATSLERIEYWLKEYSIDDLKKSIDNYISTVENKEYITIPKNFFSNSKRGKEYAPFRNFLDGTFDKVEEVSYDWGEY